MRGTIGWMIAAAAVIAIGSALPVIGVDQEALLGPPDAGPLAVFNMSLPRLSIFSMAVPRLVLVHGVLYAVGLHERPLARRIAAGIYFLLALISSFGIAMWLESFESTDVSYAVAEPGWGFRAMIVLPELGAAAIVWWLSDRISHAKVAHGVLAIALVFGVLDAPARGYEMGPVLAHGTPLSIAVGIGRMFAPVVAGALVLRWPPEKWPLTLWRNAEVRSWIDVVGLSLAAPLVISQSGVASLMSYIPDTNSWLPLLGPIVSVGLSVGLVVLWMARTERGRGASSPIGLAAGAFIALLGLSCMSFAYSQQVPDAPEILAGDASYEITLAADERFEDGDAEAMVARIEGLGASAEIVRASEERITLGIEDATDDTDAILDALRPHMLALQLVLRMPPIEEVEGLRLRGFGLRNLGGDCAAAEQFARTRTIEGCDLRIERLESEAEEVNEYGETREGTETGCDVHCLDPTPIVTGDDIAEASVGQGMNAEPVVSVRLTEHGSERMSVATRENLYERLAIVLDGEVLSAPTIQSEITERLQITLGGFRNYLEIFEEAQTLVDAFSAETRLRSTWTVVRIVRR